MPRLTLAFAAVLIILGLVAYFVLQDPGDRSATALIPAFFGVVFALLGALALKPSLRKHAMHGAAALTLLAMFGTVRAVPNLPAAMSAAADSSPATETGLDEAAAAVEDLVDGAAGAAAEADPTNPAVPAAPAPAAGAEEEPELRVTATIVQGIMFLLSTVFLVACIASFIHARRGTPAAD